ncbi:cytochrome c oxidase assembly factor CtaG [Niallia sp. Krafla_26]|uniref:cytochrome c oxidase assembly factor CtaG n=1 Tax=Niallia sp. Krafla_26 TaxID=3064703 RepID=UPI003D16BB53
MPLEIFGFRALWSPYLFITIVLVTLGYFFMTTKYRHLFKDSKPLTKSQISFFIIVMAVYYLVKGGPLDLMGHLMFYAHMIQMSILIFIIPPLLIISVPEWIWRTLRSKSVFKTVFGFFSKPFFALVLFTATLSLYHIPFVFDVVKTNFLLHEGYTAILMLFALIMWWPIVNKVEAYGSLTGLKKVAYIFASGALILPACALIIFNDNPMYATYSNPELWAKSLALCVPASTLSSLSTLGISGPEMFTSLSLIHDQQLGGVLMKIIQEIVYAFVLSRVFFEWYKSEQQVSEANKTDPYYPQTVE